MSLTSEVRVRTRSARDLDVRQVVRGGSGDFRTVAFVENDDGIFVTARFTDGSISKMNADQQLDVVEG